MTTTDPTTKETVDLSPREYRLGSMQLLALCATMLALGGAAMAAALGARTQAYVTVASACVLGAVYVHHSRSTDDADE